LTRPLSHPVLRIASLRLRLIVRLGHWWAARHRLERLPLTRSGPETSATAAGAQHAPRYLDWFSTAPLSNSTRPGGRRRGVGRRSRSHWLQPTGNVSETVSIFACSRLHRPVSATRSAASSSHSPSRLRRPARRKSLSDQNGSLARSSSSFKFGNPGPREHSTSLPSFGSFTFHQAVLLRLLLGRLTISRAKARTRPGQHDRLPRILAVLVTDTPANPFSASLYFHVAIRAVGSVTS